MLYRSLITLFLVLLSAQSNATIIDRDWYTTDTESGLDWLDVTESQGLSYNNMVVEQGDNGLFYGWHFATSTEVDDLVTRYTGIDSDSQRVTYLNNELDGLIDLLDPTMFSTNPDDFYHMVVGFFDNSHNPGQILQTSLLQDSGDNLNRNDWSDISYHQSLQRATEYENIGSFLVRDSISIPEPSILALFSLGLIGFGFTRRKVF